MNLKKRVWFRSADESGWASWTTYPEREFKGQFWCAGDATIIKDGPLYRMYYTSVNPNRGGFCVICLRVSIDTVNWDYLPAEGSVKGLVFEGTDDGWDYAAETPFLLKNGDEYWLYYCSYRKEGWQIRGNPAMIGLAKSTDGIRFERVSSQPILSPTSGWLDKDTLTSPSVIKEEDMYYMIYAGHRLHDVENTENLHILGATSHDGITWTKLKNPVLGAMPGLDWTKNGVAEAELIKGHDGKFYLFFSGIDYHTHKRERFVIGVAQSEMPFGPWDVNPQPIVVPSGRLGKFDEYSVIAPGVLLDGDIVRLWYHGFATDKTISTGYAECKWPIRAKQ